MHKFIKIVQQYYNKYGRDDLPWRKERTPYNAFLSEVMLQQTQVPRVIEKFNLFRENFNSFQEIAEAPQSKIIELWQGLGYNRRAIYLHKACKMIQDEFNGILPKHPEELILLPGIGPATAASLAVYAYNQPIPFIETNIRAVFIHHFFHDGDKIPDSKLLPLVEKSLIGQDPYEWYSALMDYGTMIKSKYKNPARKSKHHTKQSTFEGSKRQIRGKVIRLLTQNRELSYSTLKKEINDNRLDEVLNTLVKEGFINNQDTLFSLR